MEVKWSVQVLTPHLTTNYKEGVLVSWASLRSYLSKIFAEKGSTHLKLEISMMKSSTTSIQITHQGTLYSLSMLLDELANCLNSTSLLMPSPRLEEHGARPINRIDVI